MILNHDEKTWLTCELPALLFSVFNLETRGRKARLWLAGCSRQCWALLSEASRSAVETAERFADEQGTTEELDQALAMAKKGGQARVGTLDGELLSRCAGVELGWEGAEPAAETGRELKDAQRRRDAVQPVLAATQRFLDHGLFDWDGVEPEYTSHAHIVRDLFFEPLSTSSSQSDLAE